MNILLRQSGIPGNPHAGMKQKRKVASVKESVFDFIFNLDLSDWTDSDDNDDDDRKTTLLPYENPVCSYDNPVCSCDLDVLPIGHQPLEFCVECDVHATDLYSDARDCVGTVSQTASPTASRDNCQSLSPSNLEHTRDSLLRPQDSPATVADGPVNGQSGAKGKPTSGKCGEQCLSAVQTSQRNSQAVLLPMTVPDSAPVSSNVTDLTISVSGAAAAARNQQQAVIVQEGLKVLEQNEQNFLAKAGDCVTPVGPRRNSIGSSFPRRPEISAHDCPRESMTLKHDKSSNKSPGMITNCNASQVSDHTIETLQTSPHEHQHNISHKADIFVNKQINGRNFYPECETSSTGLHSTHSVHLDIVSEKGTLTSQLHQLNVTSGTSSTLPAHYTKNSHRSGATFPTTGFASSFTSVRAEDPTRASPPNSTAAERALSRTKSEPSKPVSTSQPHVLTKVTSPRYKGHGRSKSLDVFDHLDQVLDHSESGGATSENGRKQRRASLARRVIQRSKSLDAMQQHLEQRLDDADTEEAISEDQGSQTQARKGSLPSRTHEMPLTKSKTSSKKPGSVKASSFNDLKANLEGPDSSLKSAKSPKNSKQEQTISSKKQSFKSETASNQETVLESVKAYRQSAEKPNDFTNKKEQNGKSIEPHACQGVKEAFEMGESAVESPRSKAHFPGRTIQSLLRSQNSSSRSHSEKKNYLPSKKKNAETDPKVDQGKFGWLASLFSCPVFPGLKRHWHKSKDNEQRKKQTTLRVPAPIARLLGRVQSDSRLAEKAVFTVSGTKPCDGRGRNSEPTSPPVDMAVDASSRRNSALQLAVPQITLRRRSLDLDDDLKLLGTARSGCGLLQLSLLDLAADVDACDAVSTTSSSPSTSSEKSEFGERGSLESESPMDSWMPRRKKLAKKLTTALSDEQDLPFSASSESGKGSADRKPQVPHSRHPSLTSESEAEACEAVDSRTAGRRASSPGLQRPSLGSGPLPLSASRSSLLSSPVSTGPGRSPQPPGPQRSSASLPAPGSSSGAGSKTGPVVRLSTTVAFPKCRLLSVPNESDIEPEPDLFMTTGMPRSRTWAQSLRSFGSERDSPQSSRPVTPSYVHANSIEGGAIQTISACECGADGVSPFQAGGLEREVKRPLGPLALAISPANDGRCIAQSFRHPEPCATDQSHRHLQHHHVLSRRASCSECQELDSSWKGLFTARLFNRIGSKSVLRNLSHVSHVYKGTILITDMLASKILFSARSGRTIKEFLAESGSEPYCACVTPRGHVAVTLRQTSCVAVWSANGELVREFGQGVLQCPTGLACDRRGQFIVTDERANRVSIFSPQGRFIRYLGYANDDGNSDDRCRLDQHSPDDLSDDGDNNEIKIEAKTIWNEAPSRNSRDGRKASEQKVRFVSSARSAACDQQQETEGPVPRPSPRESTASCQRTAAAQKDHDTTGECVTSREEGGKAGGDDSQPFIFNVPRYACVTGSGHIVVSDSGSNSVKVFSPEGHYLRSIGRYGSQDGCLRVPYGVCSDHDDHIFVADHYNNRVSVFSLEGDFLQHALTAQSGLVRPKSLAIRPAHVRLYVAHGELRSTEVLVFRLERGGRRISFKCDL